MSKDVELSWEDFAWAHRVGWLRFESSEARKFNAAISYDRGWIERLRDDVTGACGELAFCRAIGVEWDGSVDKFHYKPDVGTICEVRATLLPDGCLVYREREPPDRWYYLVTGDPPKVTVQGSILGRDAIRVGRKKVYRRKGSRLGEPAWYVAQSDLRPFPFPRIEAA